MGQSASVSTTVQALSDDVTPSTAPVHARTLSRVAEHISEARSASGSGDLGQEGLKRTYAKVLEELKPRVPAAAAAVSRPAIEVSCSVVCVGAAAA